MVPTAVADPVNAMILGVSEDRIQGFLPDPFQAMAEMAGVPLVMVVTRIAAMLEAGTIRRVRQTLLATNLAHGALVAWQVPAEKLSSAFDWMFQRDPFSGHVVIRSTDGATAGSKYRLWTTLKVPEGYSLEKHCAHLCTRTGAEKFLILPAKRLFVLGVGHVRRKGLEIGSKADVPADAIVPELVHLSELDWRVLTALKREFGAEEIRAYGELAGPERLAGGLWLPRAREAGVSLAEFLRVAGSLHERGVIGRFSTFLEHVKPLATGEQVTRYNALFHWAVPGGREIEAGREIGRFHIMTHAYWREGGVEFGNVNIMGVAHGTDKDVVLAHKAAMDRHLRGLDIPVTYTNVFWGGRSEIKPSEISPFAYADWCRGEGLDPAGMRG